MIVKYNNGFKELPVILLCTSTQCTLVLYIGYSGIQNKHEISLPKSKKIDCNCDNVCRIFAWDNDVSTSSQKWICRP